MLKKLPIELFDEITDKLKPTDLFSLSQTCRSIRNHLLPRRNLSHAQFGPPLLHRRRIINKHLGQIEVNTTTNLAQLKQALTKGTINYLLEFVKFITIRNAQQWPAGCFPTKKIFSNVERVDIEVSGPADENALLPVIKEFGKEINICYRCNNFPPESWLAPYIHRALIEFEHEVHATTLLQHLSKMKRLKKLKVETIRLANPIAINWIPDSVDELVWVDKAKSPSIMAFTVPVTVPNVKKLSIRTNNAFDIAQYSFNNADNVALHTAYNEISVPKLVRQRLRLAVNGCVNVKRLFFDMPIQTLPEFATEEVELQQLTLNVLRFDNVEGLAIRKALTNQRHLEAIKIDYVMDA